MSELFEGIREAEEARLKEEEKKEKAKADYNAYISGLDLVFGVSSHNGNTAEQDMEILEMAEEASKRQLEDELGEDVLLTKEYLGAIEARSGGRMRMLEYLSAYKDEIKDKLSMEKIAVSEGLSEYRKKAREALFGTANVRRVTFKIEK